MRLMKQISDASIIDQVRLSLPARVQSVNYSEDTITFYDPETNITTVTIVIEFLEVNTTYISCSRKKKVIKIDQFFILLGIFIGHIFSLVLVQYF